METIKFKVKSDSQPDTYYIVKLTDKGWNCNCPAFKECKHIKKAKMKYNGEDKDKIILKVSSPWLKPLRTDSSYRMEFNLEGDGKEGIPQEGEVNRLLSWQGVRIKITAELLKE